VDIFTCGDEIDMDAATEHLRRGLGADQIQKMVLSRGALDLPPQRIKHKPSAGDRPALDN
jgi:S-adenosylmethionine decarboxylase